MNLGRMGVLLVLVGCVLAALAWARGSLIDHGRALQRAENDQANQELKRELGRAGQQLAQQAQQEAAQARTYAQQLQKEIANARPALVVPTRCPTQQQRLVAVAEPTAAPVAGAVPGAVPGPVPPDAAPPAGTGLTADAVRLWDSALAGHGVPSPACSADADAAGACATGHTLEDAWANHIENAARCREDRARMARLISWLHAVHGAPQTVNQPADTTSTARTTP